MVLHTSFERAAEAVEHLHRCLHVHRQAAGGSPSAAGACGPALTIALSRQAGAGGTEVARKVGERLGWFVYDRQLLEQVARQMGLRAELLEVVDERQGSWLRDSLARFMATPAVNENAYVRHLGEVAFSLAARGGCVLVGRGVVHFLPAETTLRVRLVAPLAHRVASVSRRFGLSPEAAAAQVAKTDDERDRFVRDHFRKDAADPCHYDLALNTARFSADECASVIVAALGEKRARRAAGPAG
jgi:cytidylate kinase